MNNSLTIYDEPLFYTEELSRYLIKNKMFDQIFHYTSKESLVEKFKNNPTEYLLIGSIVRNFQDVISLSSQLMELVSVKIAVIGNNFNLNEIRKLFEAGILCYVERETKLDEFLEGLKMLKTKSIFICNSAKERMVGYISHQNTGSENNTELLTKRETEVTKLICEGMSSKMISEHLFISVNTVETHRKKILMKLNVKNSVGIMKFAVENNLLE